MTFVSLVTGGLVGTIIMTMMILYGYMMKMMPENWNMITDGLGAMMNKMVGLPNSMGWLMHFMIGVIIHPLLFEYVWVGTFGITLGGAILNAVVFAMIFALMMIVMSTMMEIPEFSRMMMAIGIIMAHLVYGLVLGYFSTLAF